MDGSTENNAFWSFTPTQSCDYEVTFNIENCRRGSGMQYAIYQYEAGSFTNYYAEDGTGNTGTVTETFTASTAGDVVIMVDGNGGDVCETSITVNPVNCGGCTVLPVELLSFDGKEVKEGNLLEWETATESRNEFFLLERSRDGSSFEELAKVQGKGTTTSKSSYSVLDENPFAGVTYYRLKQVDRDGKVNDFDEIVAVENEEKPISIDRLYPNPSPGMVNMDISSTLHGKVVIEAYNKEGKLVKKQFTKVQGGKNRFTMDLKGETAGFYSIMVYEVNDPATRVRGYVMLDDQ